MAEHLITFLPAGQTISVTEGTNLLDAARSAGLTPNAPCGGKGTCGKCKVRLLHLPDATYEWYEKHYLQGFYPLRYMLKFNGVSFPKEAVQ